jgi:hypothetical protein
MGAAMAMFEVSYEVIAPVDHHPCGARVIGVSALNHIDASDLVRNAYGPEYAAAIQVRAISTQRIQTKDRVWHFLAPDCTERGPGLRARRPYEVRLLMERLLRLR